MQKSKGEGGLRFSNVSVAFWHKVILSIYVIHPNGCHANMLRI